MTADPEKIALYLQGTFSTANPTPPQIDQMVAAAQDIARSGFGTAILGQWHVHSDGSLFYNDSPLDSVIQQLKVIPTALTQGRVEKVLLTFGPFASDFAAIAANLDTFKKTVAGIRAQTAIDGLDWDLEGDYDQFTDLLVDLTQWANAEGMMVTAAPYTSMSTWIDVLKRTNTGGDAGFAWWNLQLYGGAYYPQWVQGLQGLVPDPASFLVPGYNAVQGATPTSIRSALESLQQSYPSVDGGFLWKYEAIAGSGSTTAQYAAAFANGLGGVTRSAKAS